MNCLGCQSASSRVLDTRPAPRGEVRRRRQCDSCGWRFTTYERLVEEREDPLELAVVEFVRGLDPTLEEATS
jgi:transcriptional regulator NrdR family protein